MSCTCCKVHGQGVHRMALATPALGEDSLALKRADRALATAAEAEAKAREEWSAAARAAARYESGLRGRYESTMRGIEAATAPEREELRRLTDVAADLFARFQEAAQVTVEKRQIQAAEAHRSLQAQIQAWGEGA